MKISTILYIGLMLAPFLCSAQSLAPDEADKSERNHFDFLIGEWKIIEKKTMSGTESGGFDTYIFKKDLEKNAIRSEWYFNRGTVSEPNYTEGLYYSAYDNLTNAWSFYYISPVSAQYYQGQKEDGVWFFYREFTIEGNAFLQRQSWKLLNQSTLLRTIENSDDKGRTWVEVYVVKLEKKRN